jgi:hypothetical protein
LLAKSDGLLSSQPLSGGAGNDVRKAVGGFFRVRGRTLLFYSPAGLYLQNRWIQAAKLWLKHSARNHLICTGMHAIYTRREGGARKSLAGKLFVSRQQSTFSKWLPSVES